MVDQASISTTSAIDLIGCLAYLQIEGRSNVQQMVADILAEVSGGDYCASICKGASGIAYSC